MVLLALRRLAPVEARRAGRPALDRGLLAAADAESRHAPGLLAALALEASALSLRFRVGAAVLQPGRFAGGITRAIAGAALLQARLARRAALHGRRLAAFGAQARGAARFGLAVGTVAFVFTGALGVVVSRFTSWGPCVICPDYSVDGFPGKMEQSGKPPLVVRR